MRGTRREMVALVDDRVELLAALEHLVDVLHHHLLHFPDLGSGGAGDAGLGGGPRAPYGRG